MLILLISVLFLAAICIVCTICGAKAGSLLPKIACFLGASLLPLFLWIVSMLLSVIGSNRENMYLFSLFFALAEAVILAIIARKISKKKVWIPLAALALCAILAFAGMHAWRNWNESIPEMQESEDLLYKYDPLNEENELARLDAASTLTLSGELLRMDGATALYPVYAAFADAVYPQGALEDAILTTDPWGWVEENDLLRCSTTAGAYEALANGEVDVIFAAAPSADQVQYAQSLGKEFVLAPIGREAFVFFVNSNNSVNDLSTEQLRGIYSGAITNWKELGGSSGRIRAFQRDEGSGSQSTLVRFMGDTPLMEAPGADVVDGMGGIITQVADYKNYKNAIGYSFRFYSKEMVQNNQIKLLSVNQIAPNLETIADGSYPLASEFYAVTLSDQDNPDVPLLIDWILSDQGQQLIERTGYVPIQSGVT